MNSFNQKSKSTLAELRYVSLVNRLSLNWQRQSVMYTCFLFISLGFADYFLLTTFKSEVLIIRFGIVTPMLVLAIGLTYVADRYVPMILICCLSIMSVSTLVILSFADQSEPVYFYTSVGIALTVIWIQGANSLTRFEANLFSGLIFAGFMLVNVYLRKFTLYYFDFLLNNLLFFAGIALLGLIISRERFARAFYRRKKIDNHIQQRVIESGKKSLRSEKIRDKLIAVISHDLRTPISSTKQILDLYGRGLLDERQLHFAFGKLVDSLDSASILLDNILSWSLLDFRKTVSGSRVNIQKIVDESVRLYKSAASLKGNQFVYEIDQKFNVEGDESMIGLVFRNLISNSVKFIKRGTITIKVTQNDTMTEVVIHDTGMEMPKMASGELFGWESILIGDNNRSGRGSDLGLLISKEIIEAHGGILSVSSNADTSGIQFYFFLPNFARKLEKSNGTVFTKFNWFDQSLN